MRARESVRALAGQRSGGSVSPTAVLGGKAGRHETTPGLVERTFRVLITGSRVWTDRDAIRSALQAMIFDTGLEPSAVIVVHGDARGADQLADQVARELGMRTEPHSANWETCTQECDPRHRRTRWDGASYCPTAGARRNQYTVTLGADVCLAFPVGKSVGTRDCVRRAAKAGIRVIDYSTKEAGP